MAKKKHIPLFDDQLEMLELLTDQEVGQAVLAAMRFMRSGTETDLTGGAGVVYQVLRAQFIRNQKALIHESFCFLTKFCSVLDVCSKDISSRNMRNRILLSNLLCLCSFSCSWGS